MLTNLQAEFVRKNIKPHIGIMKALNCTDRTARNKINGVTPITVPEAVKIKEKWFKNDNFSVEWLFKNVKGTNKSA